MSKIEEILEDLTKYISKQGKYTHIYHDDSLMNPNTTKLPAISFKVGEMKQETPQPTCNEYTKELEIRRHTKELNKKRLFSELWDFEEEIITLIREGVKTDSISRHDIDLEYLRTYPIGALVYTVPGKSKKEVFFSNIIRVAFQLRYTI